MAAEVDSLVAEMTEDIGGPTAVTAAQRAILESQRLCLLVLKVAGGYLRSEGLLNRYGKPHPLLQTCTSFANCLRRNAEVLGLERKPRKVGPTTLVEYLASRQDAPAEPASESSLASEAQSEPLSETKASE